MLVLALPNISGFVFVLATAHRLDVLMDVNKHAVIKIEKYLGNLLCINGMVKGKLKDGLLSIGYLLSFKPYTIEGFRRE